MADHSQTRDVESEVVKGVDTQEIRTVSNGIEPVNGFTEKTDLSAGIAIDPAAERRLLWKFDLRILPVLALMYLFNGLDKGNLGNAKTAGLEKDLGLVGDQYNIILSVGLNITMKGRNYRADHESRCSTFPTFYQPLFLACWERLTGRLECCPA